MIRKQIVTFLISKGHLNPTQHGFRCSCLAAFSDSDSIFRRTLLGYCAEGMHANLNTTNDGASAKASPFHALIVLGKKRLSILASCIANLSKFHVVFSSSTLIRLDKDAFEGHLCQTVNNFVKQNKSSLLSPLRKRLLSVFHDVLQLLSSGNITVDMVIKVC